LNGETQASINFWHFAAKMKTRGMREVISVAEASSKIGLDPDFPLLGYVVSGDLAKSNPSAIKGLAAASRAAKEKLRTDPAAFERLRPMMNAKTDADFEALKAGFFAGIPANKPVDMESASKMLAVMVEFGGDELVGPMKKMPDGVFADLGG
jgi:NitT/TauT family transport system substrate-binding protein